MKRRYIIRGIITLILFICVFISGCTTKDENNDKTLVVGVNAQFPPFEYVDNDGEIDGLDIALIKEIAKEMNYDITIKNMEFKSLTASLKTGGIDVAISGMTITDERKKAVDFSNEYYTATQSIIVNKDSNVKSLKDLNSKKIGVQEGTTGDILVTPETDNEIITDSNTVVKRFSKGTDAIIELKNGGIDAVVIDAIPAEKFVNKDSDNLKLIEDSSTTEKYGIAVKKGNKQLVNEINENLEKIKENGTFDKLIDNYVNQKDSKEIEQTNNSFSNLINKIKYVFISNNGYMLLLKGLLTTIYIAFFAVIVGVALGFIIALMKLTEQRKNRKTIVSRIANAYISVLRGTPVLVQLMIIYMVIFKSSYGILAAIITFGLNSGAYVAENIRAGIMAVDKGQMEGGLSLGFDYKQTMRYIIIPQAIKNCLPALGNEFIALIKETSIVGYVAIQDLTKAADFIISRTYETFLPLIAIAIAYFLIIMLLTKLLGILERRLRKSDIH